MLGRDPLWTHEHGSWIFHSPCSDGERMYFTSEKGVIAVTANKGIRLWSFDLAFCDGPMLVLEKKGLVYVGANDGNLYALESKSGGLRWESDFITDRPTDPPDFPGDRARIANTLARPMALASDGDTLFLSVFDQSRVVAIDATTGKRLWSFQTGGWIFGTAATTATHIFIGSQDRNFYCLDKKTEEQVWKSATKGRIETGGLIDDGCVYFGSCDGGLYCLSQADGKQRWRFATDLGPDGRKSAIYSVPVRQEGNICFAAGEGQVYGVDRVTGS